MRLKPEIRKIVDWAAQHGWSLGGLTGSDHIQLVHISGKTTVLPQTPSDRRSLINAKADIRRVSGIANDSGPAARYRHEGRRPRFDMRDVVREKRAWQRRIAEDEIEAYAEAEARAEAEALREAEAEALRERLRAKLAVLHGLDVRRSQARARRLAGDIVELQQQLKELGFDN